jgi:predicted ATPase
VTDREPETDVRTPDQRVRVFVSSTLTELADERAAARDAIERLHLIPVMFEVGARPHPPRALYRAYLEQSDVFVGIYWERYGWKGPEMDVSGLEDEYDLAAGMPSLLYVKRPAPNREPDLERLISRIEGESRASYSEFETADELGRRLGVDLALLLSERFGTASDAAALTLGEGRALPAHATPLVGREEETAGLVELLSRPDVRLVTLTGPGGIGKTRLALHVAETTADRFAEGVRLVELAAVTDAAEVPATIMQALGLAGARGREPLEVLATALRGRELLLLLDNFEQVVDAASAVTKLLESAPRVKALVTSRALLRIRGEHELAVPPLSVPLEPGDAAELGRADAVRLFVERVQAVRRDFDLNARNGPVVAEICRRLDGLPLAIELAAGHARVLAPEALLDRLERRLELLVTGPRDAPDRQRTLRDTIDWSYRLLETDERTLFRRLAACVGGATLEAIEDVCSGPGEIDTLAALSALLDHSLVRVVEGTSAHAPRFAMLETIREYALERLDGSHDADSVRDRHAAYFVSFAEQRASELRGPRQPESAGRLADDYDNLRAALDHLASRRELHTAVRLVWALWLFWWLAGHVGEQRALAALVADIDALAAEDAGKLLFVAGGIALYTGRFDEAQTLMEQSRQRFREAESEDGLALAAMGRGFAAYEADEGGVELLQESLRRFRELGDEWGTGLLTIMLARHVARLGDLDAARSEFDDGLRHGRAADDMYLQALALEGLGWVAVRQGDLASAARAFAEALTLNAALGGRESTISCIEGVAAFELGAHAYEDSARLLGAARQLRASLALPVWAPARAVVEQLVAAAEAAVPADASPWEEGRALRLGEAVEYARERCRLRAAASPV